MLSCIRQHIKSLAKTGIIMSDEYVMRCAIWYHLYNFKNVKNAHGGMLLLVKLQASATLLKLTLLHVHFSCFLNETNGTKSCNESHITKVIQSKRTDWNVTKPFLLIQKRNEIMKTTFLLSNRVASVVLWKSLEKVFSD